MTKNRLLSHIAALLLLAQLLLMLVSWVYSAALPSSGVRSLLSSEGIRWFFGHFASMIATPVLVWLILLAAAYGCVRESGLFVKKKSNSKTYLLTAIFLIIYIAIILLMTVVPHAVLLSASGALWPSPFSVSLVPLIAFGLLATSVIHGVVNGSMPTFHAIFHAAVDGIRQAAPILILYILLMQFYESLLFVLP